MAQPQEWDEPLAHPQSEAKTYNVCPMCTHYWCNQKGCKGAEHCHADCAGTMINGETPVVEMLCPDCEDRNLIWLLKI
jgi:hypothetical protein